MKNISPGAFRNFTVFYCRNDVHVIKSIKYSKRNSVKYYYSIDYACSNLLSAGTPTNTKLYRQVTKLNLQDLLCPLQSAERHIKTYNLIETRFLVSFVPCTELALKQGHKTLNYQTSLATGMQTVCTRECLKLYTVSFEHFLHHFFGQ